MKILPAATIMQARRQLNWNGGHGSQYIVLSELLSDQAAFITSPKTSLANYWGALPPLPPQCLRACNVGHSSISAPSMRRQQERLEEIDDIIQCLILQLPECTVNYL